MVASNIEGEMPSQNCSDCPLKAKHGKKVTAYKGRAKAGTAEYCEVPYRGPKSSVDVMIVGESPGTLEIMKRQPFIGESGELVDKELRKNGLDPSRIFFANACRCMLEKDDKTNKKLLKSAMTCCRPALEKAIQLLKPKLIVCFGDVALTQVLKQSGITKKRGIFQRSAEFDCFVFPTFHPAACFRDQGKFAFWNPDMAAMARFVREGFVMPEAHSGGAYSDVDSIRFILDESSFTAAIDTETQGKDWVDQNSVVISYSVSVKEGEGYNVWLCQECEPEEADKIIKWPRKTGNKKPEFVDVPVKFAPDYERRIAELRELCMRPDIKLTMMNGNYDLHRLHQLGIPREEVVSYTLDIQLAAHALDPDNFTKASLSNISDAFLSGRADHKAAFKENVDMSDMLKAAKEDPARHTQYAAEDTDKTLCCANVLRSHLCRDTRLATYYAKLAHPVQSLVLYDIEKNGIPFDMAKLPETKDRIAGIIRQKEQEFLELVPPKIIDKHRDKGLKLTRGDFLRDVFFSKQGFKLPVLQKTPSGDPTTDRKVMVRLREELEDCPAKEAISLLIEWGPYQKLYSTYLKGFEAAVRADGKLHTNITKTGTATGRSSSSQPNLQNIPKRNKVIKKAIRSMLVAPPGKILVAADYSQSELRWIAHESGDRNMRQIFLDGHDMHRITGQGLAERNNLVWDNLSKDDQADYRQKAKPVNFGLPYGQSAKGFQAYARDQYGVHFTLEEAETYRDAFLNTLYPGLPHWHDARKAEARKYGFVRSAYGFIRRTPNISSTDIFKQGEDERIAVNTGIQSASNDSTLLGALEARRSGLVDDKRAQLVLFIHDELIYAVDEDYVEYFVPRLLDQMSNLPTRQFGFEFSVPLIAEATTGLNLAEMKDYEV